MGDQANFYEEESIDDVKIAFDKVPKFKVEDGKTYRVCFPLRTKNSKVSIRKVDYFYFEREDKFYSFLVSMDEDVNARAEKMGADRRTRFVTILCVYKTNQFGKVVTPLSWEVVPVVLDNKKVAALQNINTEWDLTEHDISISTSNAQFQWHTYTPLKECLMNISESASLKNLGLSSCIKDDVINAADAMREDMIKAVAYSRSDSSIISLMEGGDTSFNVSDFSPSNVDEEFVSLKPGDI